LYSCENEEMQQDILRTVNVDFSHSISTRIIKESQHRSMTLKNISGETFEKYLELSKNSTQPKKQAKLKIKKENKPK